MTGQVTQLNEAGKKRLVVVVAIMVITWGLLFAGAGTWWWPAAWGFVAAQAAAFFGMGGWVVRTNPGVINERGEKREGTKWWDKVFGAVYAPQLFLLPLLAGLDVRYGWTAVSPLWQIIGFVGLIPGLILPYWAMGVNDFLVTTVRIQNERGHHVITGGPYRFVRHPMYVGAILTMICTPLALGSGAALVLGGATAVMLIVRTALEDKTLHEELPGYVNYAEQVRYRLLPGVW